MLDHQALMSRKTLLARMLLPLISVLLVAQHPVERIDLNVIHKIKTAEIGGGFGGGGRSGRGGGLDRLRVARRSGGRLRLCRF